MEINYTGTYTVSCPFTLASRHLQVAFSSKGNYAIQELWNSGVIGSVDPIYPLSLTGRVKHLVFALLEIIPVIGVVIAYIDRVFNACTSLPPTLLPGLSTVLKNTPKFDSYRLGSANNLKLTELGTRPLNLLLEAIFGKDPTTQPGSGELYAFQPSALKAKSWLSRYFRNPTFHVSAQGKETSIFRGNQVIGGRDLAHYLGHETFKISLQEIQSLLDSQKIYVSPLISKDFYIGMKTALRNDGIIILPASDQNAPTIEQIMRTAYDPPSSLEQISGKQEHSSNKNLYFFQQYLKKVEQDPASFGLDPSKGGCLSIKDIKSLTIYQLASMVVKSEDYYSLVDSGYRIRSREVGDNDAIRLISLSGIRGFFNTHRLPGNANHERDYQIMKHSFETALLAANVGWAVFPAVGMGVWGGDPKVYWTAFFDAVLDSDDHLEYIFVNPGHQATMSGPYHGYRGEEFAEILGEYMQKHPNNKNLCKIVNLYEQKTDLLLLAQRLKSAAPSKTVSLVNASDPDVTLGNHVGEYVNSPGNAPTTEENFAAAGTSGLGFEDLTGVLKNPSRIIR